MITKSYYDDKDESYAARAAGTTGVTMTTTEKTTSALSQVLRRLYCKYCCDDDYDDYDNDDYYRPLSLRLGINLLRRWQSEAKLKQSLSHAKPRLSLAKPLNKWTLTTSFKRSPRKSRNPKRKP